MYNIYTNNILCFPIKLIHFFPVQQIVIETFFIEKFQISYYNVILFKVGYKIIIIKMIISVV